MSSDFCGLELFERLGNISLLSSLHDCDENLKKCFNFLNDPYRFQREREFRPIRCSCNPAKRMLVLWYTVVCLFICLCVCLSVYLLKVSVIMFFILLQFLAPLAENRACVRKLCLQKSSHQKLLTGFLPNFTRMFLRWSSFKFF